MNETGKPMPGAERAAKKIFSDIAFGNAFQENWRKKDWLAQIIDEETGLRELLAAASMLEGFISEHEEWYFAGTDPEDEDSTESVMLHNFRAAIARAEEN